MLLPLPFVLAPFLFFQSPSACDVNQDGVVNVADVQTTISSILGLTTCPLAPASGSVSIFIGNNSIGPEPKLIMSLAPGAQIVCTDDPVAKVLNCASSINTILMATHAQIQSGKEFYCKSTNGTQAYTCSLNATSALTTYTEGMTLLLNVDAPCPSSCALNVDGVGLKPIFQADGVTLPGAQIQPGQARWVWYDGAKFRLI